MGNGILMRRHGAGWGWLGGCGDGEVEEGVGCARKELQDV